MMLVVVRSERKDEMEEMYSMGEGSGEATDAGSSLSQCWTEAVIGCLARGTSPSAATVTACTPYQNDFRPRLLHVDTQDILE
jgi:hypothetical protein